MSFEFIDSLTPDLRVLAGEYGEDSLQFAMRGVDDKTDINKIRAILNNLRIRAQALTEAKLAKEKITIKWTPLKMPPRRKRR